MYLSLSVPSDRIDVFRAAAAALLAAAAIISLISLISPVQELEAEINSFRLSGGGPAARSSAGSAADPTSTPSPTVAVLSAPVLTAQASEDGVELSWTTVHGATRYELLVWDSGNDWRQIGGDGLTGTTYTHSDLVAGTTYFYTILAVNADGETSAWSDYVSTATATATPTHTPTATATATHTPAATTGQPSDSSAAAAADPTPTASPTVAALAAPVLTAQAAEDGVELSWTTVHGATRYELFVWDSVNEWRQFGGDSLTDTTYTYTDLVAGATYFYIIRAANADGETSAWSDQVSTVTATATPTRTPTATAGQPSDSSAVDPTPTPSPTVAVLSAPVLTAQASEDGVELSWTTVHGATRYELFVWDSVNEWRQIGGDSLTDTTYTYTDLVAGATYFYIIRAANADGETSAWSDQVSTVTATATVTPTPTPAATVTPTRTPTATTGQPSDSSQNDVTVKDDSSNEGNVSPGQTSEDKTRTEPRQGLTGPTVTIAGAGGIVVVGGANQVNGASFDVTITFSENVGATFDHTDITVTNAQSLTATDVSASTAGLIYTATIRPTAGFSGAVTVQVPAAAAQNASNEDNQASNVFSATATMQSACVSGGAVPLGDEYADLARDCATLLGLHDELVGSATLSPAWSVSTDIDSWQGINVDRMRVTGLNLRAQGLTGSIPSELGNLDGLEELVLLENELTGEIPAELGGLSKLRDLLLSSNSLNSVIPSEIGELSELRYLALGSNVLTGTIPVTLGQLAKLEVLDLSRSALTGTIPMEIGSLLELYSLNLAMNTLQGPIPDELGDLLSLVQLEMGDNQFASAIPATLSQLTELGILDLRNAGLTGSLPNLGLMTSLRIVDLNDNQFTGTIPDLSDLVNLLTLDVSFNELSGGIPNFHVLNPVFKSFIAENNRFTGTIPGALTQLSSLDALILASNQLTGSVPDFSGMMNLRIVFLDRNQLSGTVAPVSNLPNLEQYTVHRNKLTGSIPTMTNVPKLWVAWFHCNQFSGEIPASLNNITSMKRLLFFDNQLTGEIPDLSALGSLEWLWLNHNHLEGDFSDTASLLAKLPVVSSLWVTLNGNLFAGVDRDSGAIGSPPSWLTVDRRDPCKPRASFDAATFSVTEGEVVTVTVELALAAVEAVTIPIAVTHNDGASAADYSLEPASSSLTFDIGEVSKPFTITATDDSDNDDGESLTLRFGTLPAGVSAGSPATATVNITDDDVPTVTVRYEQASYTVGEGNSVVIKVILSADPERTVTIPINKTNQGGATNDDYSGVAANASVTFNSGDTEKSITFTATNDSVDDDGESVLLSFGTLPTGVSAGSPATATVNITDDDVPTVTVRYEQASYTVGEGSSVVIKVILSADPERTVTIPINKANQGGATNGDYSGVAANASVTFNSGDTEESITFTATNDSVDDDDESVLLSFGTLPAGVSAGSPATATVNITDDDVPSVTVRYEQSSYTVGEGSSVVVKVILSADPERTVTIPINKANQGGATNGDYSGVPANASVTFNSGDTEKSITFAATDDSVDDDGESVLLGFGTLPAGVSAGSPATATVNITDDDVPSVTVRYEQGSYTVGEGSSEVIKVILSADPERTMTIPINKANQGGATTDDYSVTPTSLTFNSGETEKSITFAATNDTVDDDGESVLLSFGTLPAGVSAGSPATATVNITDNDLRSDPIADPDDPAVAVSYKQAAYSVAEGRSVIITIKLSADPERTVTIPISKANQGGATDADYTGVFADTSVTFNSGETEKSIPFTAISDGEDDDGESVLLGFGTLPTGVSAETPSEATVNIIDVDVRAVMVRYEQASYTVGEGSSVVIKVKLSADPERRVTISIRMLDLGGATTDDYSVTPTSLTFNSGETEKSITFAATDDSVNDDGESVRLGFGTLPTGVSRGTPQRGPR